MYTSIKCDDDFDNSLHKRTSFHLILLTDSVSTDTNHGMPKIAFATFIVLVIRFEEICCRSPTDAFRNWWWSWSITSTFLVFVSTVKRCHWQRAAWRTQKVRRYWNFQIYWMKTRTQTLKQLSYTLAVDEQMNQLFADVCGFIPMTKNRLRQYRSFDTVLQCSQKDVQK